VSSTLLGLDRKGGGVTRRRHCVVSCLSQSLPEGPCSLGCFLFSFFFFSLGIHGRVGNGRFGDMHI
jgi:hypothetical protein